MNAQKILQTLQRYSLFSLFIVLVSSVVALSGLASNTVQSPIKEGNEDIKKDFNDDDLKVKEEKVNGKWGIALAHDTSQFNDSSLPVVISGIQSLTGGGKYLGVAKIKRVTITNRSSKIVNSIQIRWTVAKLDEPEKILLERTTPFIYTAVEGDASQVIEIPALHYSRMIKPLAKNGEVYGQFLITMGMQEARFADGSFWKRDGPVAYLKFLYTNYFLGSDFPPTASLAPDIVPPSVTLIGNNRIKISQCYAQPRLTASAFSFMPFQNESCHDNKSTFY